MFGGNKSTSESDAPTKMQEKKKVDNTPKPSIEKPPTWINGMFPPAAPPGISTGAPRPTT